MPIKVRWYFIIKMVFSWDKLPITKINVKYYSMNEKKIWPISFQSGSQLYITHFKVVTKTQTIGSNDSIPIMKGVNVTDTLMICLWHQDIEITTPYQSVRTTFQMHRTTWLYWESVFRNCRPFTVGKWKDQSWCYSINIAVNSTRKTYTLTSVFYVKTTASC